MASELPLEATLDGVRLKVLKFDIRPLGLK